jgi:hypothetical protein
MAELPPFPPSSTFTRALLEAKARAHFPESWSQVLAILDTEVDNSHIRDWPEWQRTMYKLDCLFLAGNTEEALVDEVRTLGDDYRTVIWAAEDKPERWLAWLATPNQVSA